MMGQGKNDIDKLEIAGYTILKQLGRGGMAAVYLALQESIDREVALKVMLPQLSVDDSFSARFLREARIAAKLAHPNIVSVFDVGVSGDSHYISMEYHPGGDLKGLIRQGISIGQSVRIIEEVASALDFAGKKGFVHRDIKPENILFSQTGSAVLADFGIARASKVSTQITATGAVIGTPHYMSPEQIQGKEVDHRSDLYSLGVVFYQMLVGEVPYKGDSAMSVGIKHINDPIPALPQSLSKYQPFLERTMAKKAEHRWQDGREMAETLRALHLDETGAVTTALEATAIMEPATTQVLPTTASEKGGKGKLAIGLVSLLVVVGGAFSAWQAGYLSPTSGPDTQRVANAPAKQGDKDNQARQASTLKEKELDDKRHQKTADAIKYENIKRKKIAEEKRRQELKRNVAMYVSRAEDFLEPNRLSSSRLDDAYNHYLKASKLSSSDTSVKQLPKRIADAYKRLANRFRKEKNWDEAMRMANRGLEVLPGHKPLQKVLKKIKKEKKEQRRRGFGGF